MTGHGRKTIANTSGESAGCSPAGAAKNCRDQALMKVGLSRAAAPQVIASALTYRLGTLNIASLTFPLLIVPIREPRNTRFV